MRSILLDKSTEVLLFCGLATMVAVSLQDVMPVRCAQMVLFMVLAGMMGRRVRLIPPAVMLLSVVIANLFSPNGRVLFSVWRVDVTFGALRLGLLKGSLLVGLIYVSRVSVGPGLKIPGYFGALLLKAFAYFEALTEKWPGTKGGLLKRIDGLLEEVSSAGNTDGAAMGASPGPAPVSAGEIEAPRPHEPRPARKNLIAAAVLIIAGWGPYIAVAIVA